MFQQRMIFFNTLLLVILFSLQPYNFANASLCEYTISETLISKNLQNEIKNFSKKEMDEVYQTLNDSAIATWVFPTIKNGDYSFPKSAANTAKNYQQRMQKVYLWLRTYLEISDKNPSLNENQTFSLSLKEFYLLTKN